MFIYIFFLATLPFSLFATQSNTIPKPGLDYNQEVQQCISSMAEYQELIGAKVNFSSICQDAKHLPQCNSEKGRPIYHFDFETSRPSQKILVFSLIHGDERESGVVGLEWLNRLRNINARSSWRIVPVLNPDGLLANTRTNANGVDLNRNFPSKDWKTSALKYWKSKTGEDKRRFPGWTAGSESETQCALQHLASYKPDFVISIHTPYGVLDFDGPKVSFPSFFGLPWVSLGTFPGSLGRYLWGEAGGELLQQTPVLTIELKDGKILEKIDQIEKLQDIAGTVAVRAIKELRK